MRAAVVVVALALAAPAAAQEPATPLSDQSAKVRARADRWRTVGDQSLNVLGLASGAALTLAGIEEEHPRRQRAVDVAWVGSASVWLVARLVERNLRGRAEALDAQNPPTPDHRAVPIKSRLSLRGQVSPRFAQSINNAIGRAVHGDNRKRSGRSELRQGIFPPGGTHAEFPRQADRGTAEERPCGSPSVANQCQFGPRYSSSFKPRAAGWPGRSYPTERKVKLKTR